MRTVGDQPHGERLRALIVLLWRQACGSVRPSPFRRAISTVPAVPCSSGAERAVSAARSGWTAWAREQIDPWLETRRVLPTGAVRCVIHGPTAGRRWLASAARKQLHHVDPQVQELAAAHAGTREELDHQPGKRSSVAPPPGSAFFVARSSINLSGSSSVGASPGNINVRAGASSPRHSPSRSDRSAACPARRRASDSTAGHHGVSASARDGVCSARYASDEGRGPPGPRAPGLSARARTRAACLRCAGSMTGAS